jgi:hypothetical protein
MEITFFFENFVRSIFDFEIGNFKNALVFHDLKNFDRLNT